MPLCSRLAALAALLSAVSPNAVAQSPVSLTASNQPPAGKGNGGQSAPARPELRAFWADGFSDGFKTPEQVETLLQRLHDAHCNAIFAQMRKGGDAYYLSRYEPWASDNPQHFDALACLVQRAHAMAPPIQVHAWINTCAVGKGKSLPTTHVAQLHSEYLSVNPDNDPDDKEAYKIDPGCPDAAEWTFRLYLDVVRHYDVDGVHFDFVRYGAKNWGYNPVSVARFQQAMTRQKRRYKRIAGTPQPDPNDPNWKQWRRDQVTALVRKVYAHIASVNPKVVVSAATICWASGPKNQGEWNRKSAAMNRVFQDWRGWQEEGILDLACPMTYFQANTHTEWQRAWSDWIKAHQYGRASTVAVGTWMNPIGDSFKLMQIARESDRRGRRPYGVLLYSYAGTNVSDARDADGKRTEEQYSPAFYTALSAPSRWATAPPFPTDAPIPVLPWKAKPKRGICKGFVLTPALDAVDGATVTIRGNGKTWRRTTDGTGFYAVVEMPPGQYAVSVAVSGYAVQKTKVTIGVGKVGTVSFTMGGSAVPLTSSLADKTDSAPETPVRIEKLLVTLGTDTFADGMTLYAADASGIGRRVRLANASVLAFQPGDVISIAGTLSNAEGEPTIDRAVARLTDIRPMTDLPAPSVLNSLARTKPCCLAAVS